MYPENISTLEEQLNKLKSMQYAQKEVNTDVIQRGEFVVVESIDAMERYSPQMNGIPTLVFIQNKPLFYSKKYENGSIKCLPNVHSPYNGDVQEEKEDPSIPDWADKIITGFDSLTQEVNQIKSALEVKNGEVQST